MTPSPRELLLLSVLAFVWALARQAEPRPVAPSTSPTVAAHPTTSTRWSPATGAGASYRPARPRLVAPERLVGEVFGSRAVLVCRVWPIMGARTPFVLLLLARHALA
jgi:hypothetical protein